MSAQLAAVPDPRDARPVDALTSAIRPEFAVGTYLPEPDDAALWGPVCMVPACPGGRVQMKEPRLCITHLSRWRKHGKPDINRFLRSDRVHPVPTASDQRERYGFSVDGTEGILRAELQLGLQQRHDHRTTRLFASDFRSAVNAVTCAGVETLVGTEASWSVKATRGGAAFLRFTEREVARLLEPSDPLERDVWRSSDCPNSGANRVLNLRFEVIDQPWLRKAVKRWLKHRLATGTKWNTAHANLEAIRRFSEFLTTSGQVARSMGDLDRNLLVDYLGWCAALPVAAETRAKAVGGVRLFCDDYRLNGWSPRLPATASIARGEAPKAPDGLPRPVDERVMRQIEDEDNLARLPLSVMAVVVIGIRCGLRIGDVLSLPFDPLRQDSTGQHTLVYDNHKLDREVALPVVHDDVVELIERQQGEVRNRFPAGCRWLFPRLTGNPDGEWHVPYPTLRGQLEEWLETCPIVDSTGASAHVTFHQFRHTFGTRLIESGASEHLVQRLMDHRNARSTRGYAELSDQTKRKEFFKYTRFNNRGDSVLLNPETPTGDAEWMKEQLNRAQVTLPNGYCTLPLTQPCEMRNACIDCDSYFVTTVEFLPTHRKQRDETVVLIKKAEAEGNRRLVEKNTPLLKRLDTIVETLESDV